MSLDNNEVPSINTTQVARSVHRKFLTNCERRNGNLQIADHVFGTRVTLTYIFSHSSRRGFHPRIRFAFAFEAPLSFVA